MDSLGTKGIPSFFVSRDYVPNLNSIRYGNPKLSIHQWRLPKWGINCGRVKFPIMFPKGSEPFIWWPLSFPSPIMTINPHFQPLKPHLCNWALEIERRSFRVKVWVIVWEVWGLKLNSRIFRSNKDFSFQKICQSD